MPVCPARASVVLQANSKPQDAMVHTSRPEPKPNQSWASVGMGITGPGLHLALGFTGVGLAWGWSSMGLGLTGAGLHLALGLTGPGLHLALGFAGAGLDWGWSSLSPGLQWG